MIARRAIAVGILAGVAAVIVTPVLRRYVPDSLALATLLLVLATLGLAVVLILPRRSD